MYFSAKALNSSLPVIAQTLPGHINPLIPIYLSLRRYSMIGGILLIATIKLKLLIFFIFVFIKISAYIGTIVSKPTAMKTISSSLLFSAKVNNSSGEYITSIFFPFDFSFIKLL